MYKITCLDGVNSGEPQFGAPTLSQHSAASICDLAQRCSAHIQEAPQQPSTSPVYLASLPCKAWRHMGEKDIWQQLCLEDAPGFCEALEYGAASKPPG